MDLPFSCHCPMMSYVGHVSPMWALCHCGPFREALAQWKASALEALAGWRRAWRPPSPRQWCRCSRHWGPPGTETEHDMTTWHVSLMTHGASGISTIFNIILVETYLDYATTTYKGPTFHVSGSARHHRSTTAHMYAFCISQCQLRLCHVHHDHVD